MFSRASSNADDERRQMMVVMVEDGVVSQASDRGTWPRDERVGPGRDGARRLSLIFPVSPLPRGWLPPHRVSPTSSAR